MDRLDQKIDQAIGERPAAQVCEGGKGREPKRFGVPAQLVRGLDHHTLPVALDLVRPRISKQTLG